MTIAPSSEPLSTTGQTTASFSFSTTDAVATVACSLDSASFGPCTSATTMNYTGLTTGRHTFTVQSTDASGNTTSAQYSWTVAALPVNSQPPTITGKPQQGQTLTASTGTWTGGALSYSYAWADCNTAGQSCVVINGATASTYTLTASDVGHEIQVKLTARNSFGSTTAKSQPTAVVVSPGAVTGPPVNTKAPVISGTTTQGHTLTASTGTWTGGSLTYTYSWGDCSATGQNCTAISGATASTFTLRASDVGHEIQVKLTARNSAGSATAKSQPTAVVRAAPSSGGPTVKAKPVVIGTIAVGQTVSATHGAWSGSGLRYTYAWSAARFAARATQSRGPRTPPTDLSRPMAASA